MVFSPILLGRCARLTVVVLSESVPRTGFQHFKVHLNVVRPINAKTITTPSRNGKAAFVAHDGHFRYYDDENRELKKKKRGERKVTNH